MARRRRNSGASKLYAPAVKEQMNVCRLMNTDLVQMKQGTNKYYTGNSIFGMLVSAGLATYGVNASDNAYIKVARDVKVRVISVIAQPGKEVELGGTGETFINNSLEKPIKIRVPKTDLLDAQWINVSAGDHLFTDALNAPTLGGKQYGYTPFGGKASVTANSDGYQQAVTETFECITIGFCFI